MKIDTAGIKALLKGARPEEPEGKRFVVVAAAGTAGYSNGDVVVLTHNDSTVIPYFRREGVSHEIPILWHELGELPENTTSELTKREQFAKDAPDVPGWFKGKHDYCITNEESVFFAWRTYYADALIKELEK